MVRCYICSAATSAPAMWICLERKPSGECTTHYACPDCRAALAHFGFKEAEDWQGALGKLRAWANAVAITEWRK